MGVVVMRGILLGVWKLPSIGNVELEEEEAALACDLQPFPIPTGMFGATLGC